MAESTYQRLLGWAKARSYELGVEKSEMGRWELSVEVDDPVDFTASASGVTIDEAAQRLIDDLETVGAWSAEA